MKKIILFISLFIFCGITQAQIREQLKDTTDSLRSAYPKIDALEFKTSTHSILEYYASGIITAPYSASGATSTQTATAIDAAISAIGSTPTILEFPANNTFNSGGSVKSFNANTVVVMGTGASFTDSVVIHKFEGDNTLHFRSGADLSDVGNVKAQWFGVSPDSVDNNVELQHAFNSITNGGVVEIAGTKVDTFTVASGVMPKSYTTFRGDVVIKAGVMDSAATILDLSSTNNVIIDGFTFDGNKANQTETEALRLIQSSASKNTIIQNCTFINGNGYRTLQFYGSPDATPTVVPDSNLTIRNNIFKYDQGNAIELRGTKGGIITGNTFLDYGGDAIGMQENGDNLIISNNRFTNIVSASTLFAIEAAGVWNGVTVSGNTMDGNYVGVSGLFNHSAFNANNFINGTLGDHKNGFEIIGEGNIISNNRLSNGSIAITGSTHSNLSPDTASTSTYSVVSGNSVTTKAVNGRAIQIGADSVKTSYINIIGNSINVSQTSGSSGGIYVGTYGVTGLVQHINITGNTIKGIITASDGIRLLADSLSNYIFIANNIIDSCLNGISLPSDGSFDGVTITHNLLSTNATPINDPTTYGTIRKIDNLLGDGGAFTSSTNLTVINFRGGVQFTGNEYGYVLDNNNLDFGTNSFTMEYFGSANGNALLSQNGESLFIKPGAYGLFYYPFGGTLSFIYKDTTFSAASTSLTQRDGINYHIIAVANTADSTLKVYVDGSLNKTTTLIPRSASSANNFGIAVDTMGVVKSKERTYKIRLFNRALSVGEVSALYNNGRNDLNWLDYADKGATNTLISGYDTSKVSDTLAVTKFKNIYWTKGSADSLRIIGWKNYSSTGYSGTTYTASGKIYTGYYDSVAVYGDLTGSNLFYTGAVLEFLANGATTVTWSDTSGNGMNATFVGTPTIIPYENGFNELWIFLLIGIMVTILIRKYKIR